MIDPVHALAFSVQSNRGVYALLLGSGVSRASEIPTGWEITLELVRKLASLHGDDPDPTPESWYHEKYGKEPDYSDLLDQLTGTPAERQQLLRGYFEPNEQEREEGLKQPTEAHRAIAALAAQGYIKVILTTNFDRLIENALRDAGIEPTVLSSPDHVQGALPLVHTPCCVIKLHGDYLDTRIRNTPSELQTYPPEFDELLAQIFDEFGLIVCGWSAEWDEGLRNSIYRSKSRRFTTYWATRGEPGEAAGRLISHRKAEIVSIYDAEQFFQTLRENVEAVEEFSRPHPLSSGAAVAALKRYMSEPRYRIQLSDLVGDAIGKVLEGTRGEAFASVDMAAVNADSRSTYPFEERPFKGGGSRFQDGDTLMARITPCLENGKIARYRALGATESGHGSTEFIVIRGRPDITDNDFSYYLTQWEEVRKRHRSNDRHFRAAAGPGRFPRPLKCSHPTPARTAGHRPHPRHAGRQD